MGQSISSGHAVTCSFHVGFARRAARVASQQKAESVTNFNDSPYSPFENYHINHCAPASHRMNSLMYSGPTLSYERTFDGLIDIKPLVFRLHSFKYCKTIFETNKKVLRASRHASEHRNNSEEPSAPKVLAESPLSLTPDQESNAVERHITSWVKKSKEPSNFISLTFNVLFVLWEWKRRRFYQTHRSEDDFTIIVFKSSALRGRAKLGVEMLRKDHDAYQLADFNEEVIVASSIESSAILGHMPMSQLEVFIPPWCREALKSLEEAPVSEGKAGRGFRSFLDGLRPLTHKGDDYIRQSLCFALELLVPMLVPAEQQRTDDGRVLYSAAKDHPGDESEISVDHPSRATTVERTVTEKAYVPHTKLGLETKILIYIKRKSRSLPKTKPSTKPGTLEASSTWDNPGPWPCLPAGFHSFGTISGSATYTRRRYSIS
jgi:hypothetical protein